MAAANYQQRLSETLACLQRHRLWQPTVAIVLGSGLGPLADGVAHASRLAYDDIPHFCPTRAEGHAGQVVMGYLGGMPVVLLQGRAHRYEGIGTAQACYPIACMQALGASVLITTNAAGGLNPRYRAGDLMVIDSHIDFLWARGDRERGDAQQSDTLQNDWEQHVGSGWCPTRIPPYDQQLRERAKQIARRNNLAIHQGCYLATLGPTYETRSEYRMFGLLGADAVGMSTVPEVLCAQRLRMQTLAFSVITNVASTDVPQSTTHAEVVAAGRAAGPQLMLIIEGLLQELAGQPD